MACNEYCRHCGSRIGDVCADEPLALDEFKRVVAEVAEDFPRKPLLCITGGEPLLYPDLFELMTFASNLGFGWGMTTNGTLIDTQTAHRLALAGMKTVSVSLDGLKVDHEWFRQVPGSYDATVDGIRALVAEGAFAHVQLTTVVNKRNYPTLEAMYAEFSRLGVKSWRVINIEPIGRAKDNPELLLGPEEYRGLVAFIREKRHAGPMEVTYGCSHFLGGENEGLTRNWYFVCSAGIMTASIANNGDIVSCLDVERRPELVEGNVRTDRFSDVWRDGYERYRTDWRKVGKCRHCLYWKVCAGDSFHSWDFDAMEPALCMKGILF